VVTVTISLVAALLFHYTNGNIVIKDSLETLVNKNDTPFEANCYISDPNTRNYIPYTTPVSAGAVPDLFAPSPA